MDLVGDPDYDAWVVVLSKLGCGLGVNTWPARSCSTPLSLPTRSFSGFNPSPTSPGPDHYTDLSDAQWSSWPGSPDSDVLVKSDVPQSLRDADWSDALQLNNFSGDGPSPGIPYQQPQFSTPPPDWSRFKTGIDRNTATRAIDSSPLLTAETTIDPIDGRFFEHNGPTATPSTLLSRQAEQGVSTCSLGMQDQRLPSSSGNASQPTSWQDYRRTSYLENTLAGRDMSPLSPTPAFERRRRKRYSTTERTPLTSPMRQEEGADKKKTHNVAERRYRQNINSKIETLRNSVPALRAISQGNSGTDDASGLATTHALNKATVLLGATEYIQQLERQNRQLASKCEAQKARLDAIENLYTAGRIRNIPNSMGTRDIFFGI